MQLLRVLRFGQNVRCLISLEQIAGSFSGVPDLSTDQILKLYYPIVFPIQYKICLFLQQQQLCLLLNQKQY